MNENEKIIEATKLGAAAFARGALRVPALDPAVLPILSGNRPGAAVRILTAWLRAWDVANLSVCPVDYPAV